MEEGMLAPLSVANWSVFLNCMNEQNYDLNVLVLCSGGFEKNPSKEPEMMYSVHVCRVHVFTKKLIG